MVDNRDLTLRRNRKGLEEACGSRNNNHILEDQRCESLQPTASRHYLSYVQSAAGEA
jgi:hypothetical protein